MPQASKQRKKIIVVVLLSLLILCVTTGVTLAYIVKRSDPRENVFVPVFVKCEPVFTQAGCMAVSNCGDVTAYVRAAVVISWAAVDEQGNATGVYHASTPVLGMDYTILYDTTETWKMGNDGFWYYSAPVNAGALTVDLVNAVVRLSQAPAGYALSVQIVAEGIQTQPAEAITEAWGASISADGTLTAPQ